MIDCSNYPPGYAFAELMSKELGIYVKVADFIDHKDLRIFRMIIDPELSKTQLKALMTVKVRDIVKTYEMDSIESIEGVIVDNGPRLNLTTTYLRVTFL